MSWNDALLHPVWLRTDAYPASFASVADTLACSSRQAAMRGAVVVQAFSAWSNATRRARVPIRSVRHASTDA